MKTSTRSLIVLSAACLSLAALAPAASARDRSSSFTGPNGQTATRDVSRTQGNVSSSTTGPNGQTSSRVVTRSADGTQAVVTGPNGKTLVRNTVRQP